MEEVCHHMHLNSFFCPVPLCSCSENHQRGHFQCPQNKSTITSIFSVIEVVRQGGVSHAYFSVCPCVAEHKSRSAWIPTEH